MNALGCSTADLILDIRRFLPILFTGGGCPLTGISDRIDFEKIRPMLSDLYENESGQPKIRVITEDHNEIFYVPIGKLGILAVI